MTTAARSPTINAGFEGAKTPASGSSLPEAGEEPALRAVNLGKVHAPHGHGRPEVQLFRDLHLQVAAGEAVAVVGRSGTGKSSLLHLLAGLDRPTTGEVWIAGQSVTRLPAREAARVRNRLVGFVWQFHYLLPEFTAAENIALPLLARGEARASALRKAHEWLGRVELEARAEHRSGELSGGEQQRVALARALVTEPSVLLADEPTGDLDDTTADGLFQSLQQLCRERGLGAVVVTHNVELARRCDRVLLLGDGRLEAG